MDFESYLDEIADSSRKLKVSGLQRLSNLPGDPIERLAQRWPEIDLRRRRKIVEALNNLEEDSVEYNFDQVFILALEDADAEVRLAAIRGLWECESPALIDSFAALLEGDDNGAVRAEAALALGRFVVLAELGRLRPRYFERVESALARAIEKPAELEEVRARALEAIGAHDAPWVRQAVREAYESGNHRLKVGAVHAMGRSCEARWLPLLVKELGSDEAELRYEAAVACGSLGDDAAVDPLVRVVLDEDDDVRAAAMGALGEIGGSRAKDALMLLLDSESPATREAAAAALAEIDFAEDPLGFKLRG